MDFLQSNKSSTIVNYQDEFLGSVITQLKILHKLDPQAEVSVATTYRALLTVVDKVRLSTKLSVGVNLCSSFTALLRKEARRRLWSSRISFGSSSSCYSKRSWKVVPMVDRTFGSSTSFASRSLSIPNTPILFGKLQVLWNN